MTAANWQKCKIPFWHVVTCSENNLLACKRQAAKPREFLWHILCDEKYILICFSQKLVATNWAIGLAFIRSSWMRPCICVRHRCSNPLSFHSSFSVSGQDIKTLVQNQMYFTCDVKHSVIIVKKWKRKKRKMSVLCGVTVGALSVRQWQQRLFYGSRNQSEVVIVRFPKIHLLCGFRHWIFSVETINWLFLHHPLAVCLAVAGGRCVVVSTAQ